MLKFNFNYFILTLILLSIEVLIALYVHDKIIRPYIGDLLVVILIYCFLKSFLNTSPFLLVMFVLAFSFLTELLQYLNIVNRLNLGEYKLARIVIGTSFSWEDLVAYTFGAGIVLIVERFVHSKSFIPRTKSI